MSKCDARQHFDQMICGRCGLQWDVNDPDRPACAPVERRKTPRPPAASSKPVSAQDDAAWLRAAMRQGV